MQIRCGDENINWHTPLCDVQQGSLSSLMGLPVPVIRVRFFAPSLPGMLPWRWLLPTSISSRFGNTFSLLLFCNLHAP